RGRLDPAPAEAEHETVAAQGRLGRLRVHRLEELDVLVGVKRPVDGHEARVLLEVRRWWIRKQRLEAGRRRRRGDRIRGERERRGDGGRGNQPYRAPIS